MAAMKQKYPTIRISTDTHKKIKEIAAEDGVPMSDVINESVEAYRRKRIAQKANEVWAEAMKDPELREFWAREDALLEGTLMDGLEEDEHWE